MMSSPNHSTSDIEDAFSSMNILNYTSVSSDYFPASSGSISFNSSENSNIIPSVISPFYNNPYLKEGITYSTTRSYYFTSYFDSISGKSSSKIHLKHHENQIEDIFNYLKELSFFRIGKMEEDNKLKTKLEKVRYQIIKLQKKQLGQRDKIAFAHYRISNLEQTLRKTKLITQTDQEDL
ncbi:hypothetical protein Tco_1280877 [Tanacetum coccineum]